MRLLPVSLVLGYLVAVAYEPQPTAYPLTVAIRPHEAIIVLAPLGAAATAWKASRWRRAGWRTRPWRRPVTVPAVWDILGSAAVQFVAYEVIVVWTVRTAGQTVPVQPAVLVVAAATITGWAAIGFAAGWWIRAELALPGVVLASYLALVYPPAMEPLWLRHLTGTLGECCAPDVSLDPEAVRAMVLVPVAAAVASLLVVRAVQHPWYLLVALATVVFAATTAVPLVDSLGADPVSPRTGSTVCAGEPEVCVWPEQAGDLERIVSMVELAAVRWSAAGLAIPDRFSPRQSDLRAGATTRLVLWQRPDRYQVVNAMASGVLPDPLCNGSVLGDIYQSRLVAVTWLTIAGGVEPALVASRTDPVAFRDAERVAQLDRAPRLEWLNAVEQADPCTGAAVPIPS